MKMDLKKILFKSGITSVVILVLFINCGMIINLMLNKQYVVREISSTNNVIPLKRMEEIISYDYVGMFYYLLINSILIIALLIFYLKRKEV